MRTHGPEQEPGAVRDWGLQFVAGFLLMAAVAVAIVGLVIVPGYAVAENDGGTVTVTSAVHRAPPVEALFPSDAPTKGVDLLPKSDEFDLVVSDLPTRLRLLSVANVGWFALCTLGAGWMVFGLLRSIGEGRPFDRHNARRLTWLATITVVGPLGFAAIGSFAASSVLDYIHLSGGNLQPPAIWSFWPFLVAALILAVANAFRHGRTLQDDVVGMV